ncbi:MAG: lysine 5,6-aminomutase subunit alpha [bacterium]
MSKLNLDRDLVDSCRKMAESIVSPVLRYVDYHSTVSIERSVLRLFGVEGPGEHLPLVNEIVAKLDRAKLSRGVAHWFCRALLAHPRMNPQSLAVAVAKGEIDINNPPEAPFEKIDRLGRDLAAKALHRIQHASKERDRLRNKFRRREEGPLKYLIVATGNIYEDIVNAQAAAEMGADIIAVIRSTAQSLLDFVPEGATTEGFGGTYATQKNFELMRKALDETSQKIGRYVGLTNYSSGLCMPEIAVMGAYEGLDYLLNDSMYGILFRDINMKRTFTDQYFSRVVCSKAGITIMTGEDNYLTTAESHKEWHQVLASQLINEAFAKRAGIPDTHIALGHAFEMDPELEDSILMELAQAQLVREFFPYSPIKFMPPTRHKTGDVFFANLYDGLFNLTGAITGQSIQLLGMLTEAIHNPYLMDRFIALKNANYIFKGASSLYREVLFQSNGKVARRARHVMESAARLLKRVEQLGLMTAIEQGMFAHMARFKEGGKGLDGVFQRDRNYYNPFFPSKEGRAEAPEAERGGRDRRGQGARNQGSRRSEPRVQESRNQELRSQEGGAEDLTTREERKPESEIRETQALPEAQEGGEGTESREGGPREGRERRGRGRGRRRNYRRPRGRRREGAAEAPREAGGEGSENKSE